MRIANLHTRVLKVLNEYPETRSDDSTLHAKILELYYGKEYLTQPYIITLSDKSLPKLESVGRARRKCQELYPELMADEDVEAARELKEEEYKDYARNTIQ